MKVTVGNETYLTHWETRKFNPEQGNNTALELEATDCIIRKFMAKDDYLEIARGHVSQTACDTANSVIGRRLSFLKAISGMDRSVRKALGHEYNRTCRVTSRSPGQKNRKLRQQVKALQSRIADLEKAAKTEEVVA